MLENYNKSKKFGWLVDNHLDKLGFPISFHITLRILSRLIDDEELKVYIINDEQNKLLINTKNQIYPRPLPHWCMFLETEFSTESLDVFGLFISINTTNDETLLKYGGGSKLLKNISNPLDTVKEHLKEFVKFCEKKGVPKTNDGKLDLSGFDTRSLMKKHEQETWNDNKNNLSELTEKEIQIIESDVKNNKYRINYYFWGFDNRDKTVFVQHDSIKFKEETSKLLNLTKEILDYARETEYKTEEINFDMDNIETLSTNIKIFVCNFLDFVNNPDVEIIPFSKSKERNLKRARRGKLPIPEYRIIKLKGELKRYLDKAKSERFFEYSHKFIVRGHFRRFWDKERYRNLYKKFEEEKLKGYYLDKKNKVIMIHIFPSIKGKGLMIDQIYEIEEKRGK